MSISARNGSRTTSRRKFTRWSSGEKGTAERCSLKIPDCFSLQGRNDSLRRQQCKNSCQLRDPTLHSTLKLKLRRSFSCSGAPSTTDDSAVARRRGGARRGGPRSDACPVPFTSGFTALETDLRSGPPACLHFGPKGAKDVLMGSGQGEWRRGVCVWGVGGGVAGGDRPTCHSALGHTTHRR